MKRLRRILLNAATALSLLLCVLVGVMWVRSYWHIDWFRSTRYDPASRWSSLSSVGSALGELVLQRRHLPQGKGSRGSRPRLVAYEFDSFPVDASRGMYIDGLKPFRYVFEPSTVYHNGTECFLVVKMWLPFACFAVLPAVRGARRVRRRNQRDAPGLCPACGYDLRATPDRCPECGRQPASS